MDNWQTPLALFVVALTVALFAVRAWKKRKNPGCGGDCACPADDFKAKLKK